MDCRYKVTCSERDVIVELSSYRRFEGTGLMPAKKMSQALLKYVGHDLKYVGYDLKYVEHF